MTDPARTSDPEICGACGRHNFRVVDLDYDRACSYLSQASRLLELAADSLQPPTAESLQWLLKYEAFVSHLIHRLEKLSERHQ